MNQPEFELVQEAHRVWMQVTEGEHTVRERIPRQLLQMNPEKLALMLEPLAKKLREKLLAMNR